MPSCAILGTQVHCFSSLASAIARFLAGPLVLCAFDDQADRADADLDFLAIPAELGFMCRRHGSMVRSDFVLCA
jgi:hypothetical protein